MNKKTIVIVTVIATLAVLFIGYSIYQYEIGRNQTYYNAGYNNGLLHTQQTGKMVFLIDGNLTELTMPDEWKMQIQQYLNLTGGQ